MGRVERFAFALAVGATAVASGLTSAQAQYPDKRITIVIPFVPGGPTDLLARLAGEAIAQNLGATVVPENRPGASGNVAAQFVTRSPADGYTLMFGTGGTHAINSLIFINPGYDPIKDFAPVAAVASTANVLVVNPKSPMKTFAELIDYAKKNPGKLSYGSGGYATSTHLAAELFKLVTHVDINHVPYKGTAPALQDLIAGHTSLVFDSVGTANAHIQAGLLKPLAVTTAERSPLLPNVPTIAELGYPDFEVTVWYGLFAPAGTPREIVEKLNRAVNDYLTKPEIKERLAKLGMVTVANTPEYLGSIMKLEQKRWSGLVKTAGIRME